MTEKFCYRLQRSWDKVIFSQTSVILSTVGCLVPGGLLPGGLLLGGPGPGGLPDGDPPRTATAVGGTHPTGMHSCLIQ